MLPLMLSKDLVCLHAGSHIRAMSACCDQLRCTGSRSPVSFDGTDKLTEHGVANSRTACRICQQSGFILLVVVSSRQWPQHDKAWAELLCLTSFGTCPAPYQDILLACLLC